MARGKATARRSRIFFDGRDYELLSLVNGVLEKDETVRPSQRVFYPFFHPLGIKELTESRGLRIAFSVVQLLDSLEAGKVEERLNALRSLKEEVVNAAEGPLPRNTARALLQIMKELVRAHGDPRKQLELAHDFRTTACGKPRPVREQLRRYHLLEMPEEWNQVSFDDHVHDVYTKGRKNPTHLIMDAWIKGIRRLRVIYYNYIQPSFAAELLEAADIMGITVRIGIEFATCFRDRYAQLIWVPRGFPDVKSFLAFLAEPEVVAFMSEGRKVSEYRQRYVLEVLTEFNETHRLDLNASYGLNLTPVRKEEFLAFVGSGQASVFHLAKFIHTRMVTEMRSRTEELRADHEKAASEEERRRIAGLVREMDNLDEDALVDCYLSPSKNPSIPDPNVPAVDPSAPALLTLSPSAMIDRLVRLHTGYRITLNLSNLKVEDVLEILYDCRGRITRLEIFNLKDYAEGKTAHIPAINDLQRALNEGNVISLKRVIRDIIDRLRESAGPGADERIEKLTRILHDISTLRNFYKERTLKSRIASDSTGRSSRMHGMGLVIRETLPRRARKQIQRSPLPTREPLPVRVTAHLHATYIPRTSLAAPLNGLYRLLRGVPGLRWWGHCRRLEWLAQEDSTRMGSPGNILMLGGVKVASGNGLNLHPVQFPEARSTASWRYLNSRLKQVLKVVIGFVPAFLTFAWSKDWWLLAYFGAFIWFGITGLRNIVQSVLGGGGFRRSPLLHWNDFVSWERLADSLFFTGFSVPLLDYLVKTVILDRGMGINTSTDPLALYALMALANGIYLSSHNIFRGLPKGAVTGNFFRSILSIPIAVLLNAAAGAALTAAGAAGVNEILQKWAAIISKAASDFVAGFIEGLADRFHNIRLRQRDYKNRFALLFDTYARLELLFPDAKVFEIVESPGKFLRTSQAQARDLEKLIIIGALDLLYFWMYQPRARSAFRSLLENLSQEEKQILLRSQFILLRHRTISRLFVDGILGRNFSSALAFYLGRSPEYLEAIARMKGVEIPQDWVAAV